MRMMSEIQTSIFQRINELLDDKTLQINGDTPLLGDGGVLDSMNLVQLCLALEDMASEIGFEFDWTSDVAMSKSRSMFRTAGSIAAEFIAQMETKK